MTKLYFILLLSLHFFIFVIQTNTKTIIDKTAFYYYYYCFSKHIFNSIDLGVITL